MRFRGAIGFCAEPTLSANLLRFLDRVQQLLVRVIFLPGISDSNKPISRITFHRANRFSVADLALQQNRVIQVATASSASSLGTWTQIYGQSDYVPATTVVSRGQILRHIPCISAGGAFADKSLCLEDSLASGRPIYLLATACHLLFLPGITE
jgi:hypothetical protein